MYPQPETNPHFLPRQYPPYHGQPPRRHREPVIDFSPQSRPHPEPQPSHGTHWPPPMIGFTSQSRPRPGPEYVHEGHPTQPQAKPLSPHPKEAEPPQQHVSRPYFPTPIPQRQRFDQHGRPQPSPSLLRVPTKSRTRPIAWLVAACCALFWLIIIVGGIAVLVIYLVFRPRGPKFDISSASLNAVYLDMGYLLNADLTLLANFTNPNSKVNVEFSYIVFDLYYEGDFVATRYVEPFYARSSGSKFAVVHLVASQVRLPLAHTLEMTRQLGSGRVNFEIRGLFKAKYKFGGLLKYSDWLYARCKIVVSGPPNGVLIGKKCETKH